MWTPPWTDEQIDKLNTYQNCGYVHPFSCGNDSCRAMLIATRDGWRCSQCDYQQFWAYDVTPLLLILDSRLHRMRERPLPTVRDLQVMSYRVNATVTLERRAGDTWSVCRGSDVLNRDGEWENEPPPSERSDNFIERTRFATAEDALAAYHSFHPYPRTT